MPILVAEHVVSGYGTGVVMGVPAHDQRDLDFAVARGLPVVTVVEPPSPVVDRAFTEDGRLVRSGRFSGMPSDLARPAITDWLESRGVGHPATRYRLHDWLISRQRYWGPPIPIVHCDRCGPVAVPEEQLPVLLPAVEEFRPTGTGLSPLATVSKFVETPCPACHAPAKRETDVSDNFLDSAWYFLRYPSSQERQRPWDPHRVEAWLPVDLYAGGREHVMRHHLYARFLTRALHDLGLVPFAEPFPRLRLHGLLIQEGAKMSKSRGNVANPDDYIDRVGADNLRMYLLFCGAWEEGGDFSDKGLNGIVRFTRRLGALVLDRSEPGAGQVDTSALDRAVARIEGEIERFKFNAALMEATNWAVMSAEQRDQVSSTLVLLVTPFAPHVAEELWQRLGHPYSVHRQRWPAHRVQPLAEREITLVVQVDGKVRARLRAAAGITEADAVNLALDQPAVVKHLSMGRPRQVVYVADRLINLVSR